jgi:hypothetical protein
MPAGWPAMATPWGMPLAGATNIVAVLRRNSAYPEEALALLGLSYTCH